MFTGFLPHELAVEELGWLDGRRTTLAEVLSARGYDTGGFIANTFFCGLESGLGRGFQTYEDHPCGFADVIRSSSLGWLFYQTTWRAVGRIKRLILHDPAAGIVLNFHRKDAATVNEEFLAWLSRPRSRPFLAFLNYFNAHDPYIPARAVTWRFTRPQDPMLNTSCCATGKT